MTILVYPPQDPEQDPMKREKITDMTMVPSNTAKGSGVVKRGNGKTLKEIAEREERVLARAGYQSRVDAAQRAAAEMKRISELKAQQRDRKFDMYSAQEEARAPQFQIDQRPILWILISLAAITFVTTAMLTADGTIGAAASARFAIDWFGFVLFGVFEVATLAFMLMYYIRGSRIDYDGNRVKSSQWFVAMIIASVITVALSSYHVLDLYKWDVTNIAMWVGIGIRVTASVFFLLISKGIAGVLFAKAIRL